MPLVFKPWQDFDDAPKKGVARHQQKVEHRTVVNRPSRITVTPAPKIDINIGNNGATSTTNNNDTMGSSTNSNQNNASPLSMSAAAANGACTVGVPYSISMSASDLPGNQVRFLVDWNADGTVDEVVPPNGWAPLCSTQAATRTYTTSGQKLVKIMAQDAGGNNTGWQTVTFNCADQTSGQGSGDNGGGDNGGGNGNGGGQPIITDLTLTAIPSLVRSGDTTSINWGSTNMTMCSVSSTNGDAWPTDPTDPALQSPIGGEVSAPITAQTTYTLTCLGVDGVSKSKSVQVNIIPTFHEQ